MLDYKVRKPTEEEIKTMNEAYEEKYGEEQVKDSGVENHYPIVVENYNGDEKIFLVLWDVGDELVTPIRYNIRDNKYHMEHIADI